jgi:hypothetical protein
VLLLLVYAVPFFWPPAPGKLADVPAKDAALLERIFPGVPTLWVAVRLLALALGATLLSSAGEVPRRFRARPVTGATLASGRRRVLALVAAVLLAATAPFAASLGPGAQMAYLVALFTPAILLRTWARRAEPRRSRWWLRSLPVAVVIVVWVALRLASDLNSPLVANVVDGWRGVVAMTTFVDQRRNVLTDLFEADLPGLGALPFVLQGVPLFEAGIAVPTFRCVQVLQILWVAATAAGVAALARLLFGRGAGVIAAATLLFAPYTRFVSIFPGPFLAGPLYGVGIGLCAVAACRWRSEAALAALGAMSGIAVTLPGAIPVAAFLVVVTAWCLRREWWRLWAGWGAGGAAFAAVVVPALPNVLTPERMAVHFRWDGVVTLIDAALMGQLPIRTFTAFRSWVVPRPPDIVIGALLAPFAHPRIAIRLWGDTLFDPLGAALTAIGIVTCVRTVRSSRAAGVLLLAFLAALSPAFSSPVNVVDITHAVVVPAAVALLASAGFVVVRRGLVPAGWRRRASFVAAATICIGGTVLVELVNPRILNASSLGIMFRVVRSDAFDRVVVLGYPKELAPGAGWAYVPKHLQPDAKWLYMKVIADLAGPRPVAFLEYGGDDGALSELVAGGKDLFFWSPGFDRDFPVTDSVCGHWPDATVFEIWDDAHLGRVYAARVGTREWSPTAPREHWSSRACASSDAAPG